MANLTRFPQFLVEGTTNLITFIFGNARNVVPKGFYILCAVSDIFTLATYGDRISTGRSLVEIP